MNPLNPADLLSVQLEAQQWNQILSLISDGPFRIVQPIIQAMHEQLTAPQQRTLIGSRRRRRGPDNVVPMGESA